MLEQEGWCPGKASWRKRGPAGSVQVVVSMPGVTGCVGSSRRGEEGANIYVMKSQSSDPMGSVRCLPFLQSSRALDGASLENGHRTPNLNASYLCLAQLFQDAKWCKGWHLSLGDPFDCWWTTCLSNP